MRQLGLELYKLVRRTRSYLGFGWMLVVCVLMAYGIKNESGPVDLLGAAVPKDFEMVGSIVNAEFLAYLIMRGALLTFVPLFVCLVTGDLVAGEAADGTLRPLLTRPVTRGRVLGAKLAAAVLYSVVLTMFLGAAALGIGWLFFGHGDLLTIEEGIAIFPRGEALARLSAAYALAALGMLAVGSLAFLLSTIVSSSLAALGGAMMTMYALVIIGEIQYFKPAAQYFFTTHMLVWQKLFGVPVQWDRVAISSAYLAAYVAAFSAAAFLVFRRKDILS